jgi:hypothetical protein
VQQFLVPQFIDVEDKIIGPITTRQFVEVLIGVLITFISYKILAFVYFAFFGFLTLALTAIIAFVRINGRPIHFFMLNFLQTSKRPRLRVWNRAAYARLVKEVDSQPLAEKKITKQKKRSVSGSRLRDVSLVVNTGGVYDGGEMTNEFKPL